MSNSESQGTEQRTVIVDGTTFVLPKLWADSDVSSLMEDFKNTRDDYVSITQDDGVVHVLMTSATSVRFEIRTVRPSRVQVPRRIR